MSRWLKRRPVGEFRVFAQALFALPVTRLALHWASLASVRRRLWSALSAERPLPSPERLPMGRVVRCAVAAGKLWPAQSTCLVEALVIQALLHRHGYTARLRIGVRLQASGDFAAHAWLEYDGAVIVGGPVTVVDQYQALPELEHLIA